MASIASGLGVILFKNAVHSALSLILTLLFLALFYLQLGAMFIAIVQVLIYAGAIMVLFLFVVTMLAMDTESGSRLDRISAAKCKLQPHDATWRLMVESYMKTMSIDA